MGRRGAAAKSAAEPLAPLDRNEEDVMLPSDDEDMDESYLAPSTRKSSFGGASSTKKHFLDDDDEDADESYMAPLRDYSDDDEDGENSGSRASKTVTSKPSRRSIGRKSIGGNKKNGKADKRRARRRSSARFLRLSGRFGADDEDDADGNSNPTLDKENLGEVYRQAIRMNAENKINAGNSWGLKLIENMDKLVHGDDVGEDAAMKGGVGANGEKRVNFTKASCTLDASVKIYGYRVDDVHLTSYKVLHNLNRTDAGGSKKKQSSDDGLDGGDVDSDADEGRTRKQKRGTTDTLESNLGKWKDTDLRSRIFLFLSIISHYMFRVASRYVLSAQSTANINMSKLDSAPDIDPLFRKMSKAFDEGGAKGLLLNNLGVARDGCRIEFDSKEDTVTESVVPEATIDEEDEAIDEDIGGDDEEKAIDSDANEVGLDEEGKPPIANDNREEGMVDITSLVTKLQEVLNGSSLESLPFVPQLEMLRADYAALEADGFADEGKRKSPTSRPARYGVTDEEEKEAERSIHMEAIERSHRSTANVSFARLSAGGSGMDNYDRDDDDDDGGGMFGADDFGGGGDDFDDDDDDDMVFNNFLAMDTNAEKYSAVEFHGSQGGAGASEDILPATAMRTRTTTTALLDAICSSDALIAGGEFEYFDADTLDKITKGNMWAGSDHWKKTDKIRSKKQKEAVATSKNKKTTARTSKKKAFKERAFVDLTSSCHSCLDDLIKDKPKSKGKSKSDPLQLTKAAIAKQEKNDNVLPPDAGVGIEQLSRLFMRPDAAVQPKKAVSDIQKARKSVGFFDTGPTVFADGDDGSFGDDDDGPGFQLADDDDGRDDFVIEELEGVRKVEKVKIGYATVAKKVDVKRLKKDLWNNLESKTATNSDRKDEDDESSPDTTDIEGGSGAKTADEDMEKEINGEEEGEEQQHQDGLVSFQDTLKELSISQSQNEITLPFYFICILHLANEKGLYLDPSGNGLNDFIISRDDGSAPSFGTMPEHAQPVKARRKRGGTKKQSYQEDFDGDEDGEDSDMEAMSEDEN